MPLRFCFAVMYFQLGCASILRSRSSRASPGRDSLQQVLLQVGSRSSGEQAFSSYKAQFGRMYDGEENQMREEIFHKRMAAIQAINDQHRAWRAGINHLTDRTDAELRQRRGYRRQFNRDSVVSLLDVTPEHSSFAENHKNVKGCSAASQKCESRAMEKGGQCCNGLVCGAEGTCAHPEEAPAEKDWTSLLSSSKQVVDQGSCGSCWTIAAIGITELQASKISNKSLSLSAQGMLGCSPNPKHCGGEGGCEGSTPELGLDWVKHRGFVTISEEPYLASDNKCPDDPANPAVTIQGFFRLQENKAQNVINSLVSVGPLAVAVAADSWSMYSSGVFDSCSKSPVVDHAVVLMGYGSDSASGKAYWNIRNSWGHGYGEGGFIRLLRHAPDGEEPCGWDNDPQLGVGCDGGPKKLWVCGECGVLSDVVQVVGTQVHV